MNCAVLLVTIAAEDKQFLIARAPGKQAIARWNKVNGVECHAPAPSPRGRNLWASNVFDSRQGVQWFTASTANCWSVRRRSEASPLPKPVRWIMRTKIISRFGSIQPCVPNAPP